MEFISLDVLISDGLSLRLSNHVCPLSSRRQFGQELPGRVDRPHPHLCEDDPRGFGEGRVGQGDQEEERGDDQEQEGEEARFFCVL